MFVIVTCITECLVALITLVRFIAQMTIRVISILILSCKSFVTNFTLEGTIKLGILFHLVPNHVSLKIEGTFKGLLAHSTDIGFWNFSGICAMSTQMFVQVTTRNKCKRTSRKGTFEGTRARVCTNVTCQVSGSGETTLAVRTNFVLFLNVHTQDVRTNTVSFGESCSTDRTSIFLFAIFDQSYNLAFVKLNHV